MRAHDDTPMYGGYVGNNDTYILSIMSNSCHIIPKALVSRIKYCPRSTIVHTSIKVYMYCTSSMKILVGIKASRCCTMGMRALVDIE
jgi:hypothetical protein